MSETLENLDVSLQDFEHPLSPVSLRHSRSPSEEPMTDPEDYHDHEEGEEEEEEDLPESETGSVGGYSPPAWRRLGNGNRSSGFWRRPVDGLGLGALPLPFSPSAVPFMTTSREGSPMVDDEEYYSDEAQEGVLERAIRTKLPKGSQSPDRTRESTPERQTEDDTTLKVEARSPSMEAPSEPMSSENYIRFAVRAEVQQRTEPIETAIAFIRKHYATMTASWSSTLCSILVVLLSISFVKTIVQPASPRPAGDLVKVAGVARSFEPLIYYSEHAILQVHDLQATSIAVWDLGESVRTSDMKDASSIVSDLDGLSDTMKTLAEEMTRFLSHVDGDMDAILNVMDWGKMHLNRFQNTQHPSTLSSAYDNLHNILSQAHVLEDATGALTPLGTVASFVFGPSNPQREQRVVQTVFRELLTVLEEAIQSELQHSLTLFALFEAVDRHMLNLARTVVRESSAQEELHADLLSGLWARILGPRAADVRKFEQNRVLLRDVRDKTVRNRGVLEDHNMKLLSLKASLEGVRTKLVSPLVRGANTTTLSLEDQIRGISDVSSYLGDVRRVQKGRVMESMFAGSGRRYLLDQGFEPISAGRA